MHKIVIALLLILFIVAPVFAKDITFTIPADKVALVIDSFCSEYSYQAQVQIEDASYIPNPETKEKFTKRMIIQYIKDVVKTVKVNEIGNAARQRAIDDPENDVDIQ